MVADDEYVQKCATVNESLQLVFSHLLRTDADMKVLLYEPIKKYREVRLEPLKESFPDMDFDIAPMRQGTALPRELYDVIVIPLFGYTASYRLGHGGGWYDRLLAEQTQAKKIGVGLETGMIDFIVDAHDVPMDIIITEMTDLKDIVARL